MQANEYAGDRNAGAVAEAAGWVAGVDLQLAPAVGGRDEEPADHGEHKEPDERAHDNGRGEEAQWIAASFGQGRVGAVRCGGV